MNLDYDKIENIDVEINGEANDYCDSFIMSADYCGRPMTDEELDELNDDEDFVYQQVMNKLY